MLSKPLRSSVLIVANRGMWEGCHNMCVSWIIRRSHNLIPSLRLICSFTIEWGKNLTEIILATWEHFNTSINSATLQMWFSVVKNNKNVIPNNSCYLANWKVEIRQHVIIVRLRQKVSVCISAARKGKMSSAFRPLLWGCESLCSTETLTKYTNHWLEEKKKQLV